MVEFKKFLYIQFFQSYELKETCIQNREYFLKFYKKE